MFFVAIPAGENQRVIGVPKSISESPLIPQINFSDLMTPKMAATTLAKTPAETAADGQEMGLGSPKPNFGGGIDFGDQRSKPM